MGEKVIRCRFSPEIRQNSVNLVVEGGRSCSEVSAEHNLPEGSIYAWIRRARNEQVKAANGDGTSEVSLREEIESLRRELKDARDNAFFLQKTAARIQSDWLRTCCLNPGEPFPAKRWVTRPSAEVAIGHYIVSYFNAKRIKKPPGIPELC